MTRPLPVCSPVLSAAAAIASAADVPPDDLAASMTSLSITAAADPSAASSSSSSSSSSSACSSSSPITRLDLASSLRMLFPMLSTLLLEVELYPLLAVSKDMRAVATKEIAHAIARAERERRDLRSSLRSQRTAWKMARASAEREGTLAALDERALELMSIEDEYAHYDRIHYGSELTPGLVAELESLVSRGAQVSLSNSEMNMLSLARMVNDWLQSWLRLFPPRGQASFALDTATPEFMPLALRFLKACLLSNPCLLQNRKFLNPGSIELESMLMDFSLAFKGDDECRESRGFFPPAYGMLRELHMFALQLALAEANADDGQEEGLRWNEESQRIETVEERLLNSCIDTLKSPEAARMDIVAETREQGQESLCPALRQMRWDIIRACAGTDQGQDRFSPKTIALNAPLRVDGYAHPVPRRLVIEHRGLSCDRCGQPVAGLHFACFDCGVCVHWECRDRPRVPPQATVEHKENVPGNPDAEYNEEGKGEETGTDLPDEKDADADKASASRNDAGEDGGESDEDADEEEHEEEKDDAPPAIPPPPPLPDPRLCSHIVPHRLTPSQRERESLLRNLASLPPAGLHLLFAHSVPFRTRVRFELHHSFSREIGMDAGYRAHMSRLGRTVQTWLDAWSKGPRERVKFRHLLNTPLMRWLLSMDEEVYEFNPSAPPLSSSPAAPSSMSAPVPATEPDLPPLPMSHSSEPAMMLRLLFFELLARKERTTLEALLRDYKSLIPAGRITCVRTGLTPLTFLCLRVRGCRHHIFALLLRWECSRRQLPACSPRETMSQRGTGPRGESVDEMLLLPGNAKLRELVLDEFEGEDF